MTDAINDLFSLTGRTALVTGAASGIGRGIAELYAAAGANVVCVDINGESAEEVAVGIREAGGQAVATTANIAVRSEVVDAYQLAVDTYGKLDIAANVAGIPADGLIADIEEDDFDRLLAINLKGTLWGSQEAVKHMIETGGGSIINVASGSIDTPAPGFGAYAMTKAAVSMMSKTLATEVGKYNIRVNTLVPAATVTGFTSRRLLDDEGNIDPEKLEGFNKMMARQSPLRRVGQIEDQANMALFLASDASNFCTGQLWRPNGGQAMPW